MKLSELAERLAPLRESRVELIAAAERAHGFTFDGELREWLEMFERFEMEAIEPSLTELRAPDAAVSLRAFAGAEDPSWIASVISLFTATSVVGQQDDLSYLAAWAPSPSGLAKVYHFHPDDWGMWPTDPSLAVRLHRMAGKQLAAEERIEELRERGRSERLDPRLDPERLFPRVSWLVHLFCAHGGDWKTELAQAATIVDWDAERELVAVWPHLAIYWLWSHYMFGNRDELDEVMDLTRTAGALVAESRELIRRLDDGEDVRIGERNGATLETFREQLQDDAPPAVLGSGAKERRDARDRAKLASEDEEQRARAGLAAIAERDPKVRDALRLLSYLEEGGALVPATLKAREGLTVAEAIDKFTALIDHRFRPLLLAKIRKSARFGDASPHATLGLIIAFQKLAASFDELDSVVRAIGTGNFGPRRLAELHRAWGRCEDPRAVDRLAEHARQYLAEVESWEPKMPGEAFVQLLSRDLPVTHELIAEMLERASFSGANSAIAVLAAEAAGRLESKRAIKGLERAVERELGRIDDGSRARVIAALVACAGKSCAPFLRGLYDARIARWESESDRRAAYSYHHKDLACWLSGLLPLAPRDRVLLDKTREMLATFREELGPGKKPRRDVIYALAALFRGIGNGRVTALKDAVAAYVPLEFTEDRATIGLKEMLSHLVQEVLVRVH